MNPADSSRAGALPAGDVALSSAEPAITVEWEKTEE
jgi:hypothetical protein